jgi:hypothetical protein
MAVVSIMAVILFDTILCVIEIPKMLQQKLIKELVTLSVLLLFGTVIAIMKSFDMKVPNPSDFLSWVYSPVSDLMKSLLKP